MQHTKHVTLSSQLPAPSPQRILVIGLSNIGDAVLMTPVIARLHQAFPDAEVTLLAGERARAVFADDPRVHRVVVMEAFGGLIGRLRLAGWVWSLRPDLLIDLRHTILPLLWRPWRAVRYYQPIPRRITHMRDRHLWKLDRALGSRLTVQDNGLQSLSSLWIAPEDRAAVDALLRRWSVDPAKPLVLMSPGARSHTKRWYADRFAALADRLIEDARAEVILTGEPDEAPVIREVLGAMRHRAHSAVGSTTIRQLGALMERAGLVITNDSAALHVAGAVGAPVVALFGPTDPAKYGPSGARSRVIQRRLFCVPCEEALCRYHHECMRFISADEVYNVARRLLEAKSWKLGAGSKQ